MKDSFKSARDVSREGFRWIKLAQFFRLFLPWVSRAVLRVDKVTDLNLDELERKLGKKFKGVILDFDETLASNHGGILDENFKYVEKLLKSGRRGVIYSNMIETPRYDRLKKIGVKVCNTVYPKPDCRGFEECCKELGCEPREVLMVGDNLITDGGAIKVGIDFVKVRPVPTKEGRFDRLGQRIPRWVVDKIAKFWDLILRRR